MSDYKNIEQKLANINQVEFQNIVYRIIAGEYNNPKNISYLGGAKGENKTRKGTPDVFFQLDNGNYVFVEVTTQKTEIGKKIIEDIDKCKKIVDSEKILVEKIIYAWNDKITVHQVKEYNALAMEWCVGVIPFEFWGLDKITNFLATNYQNVAVDELNMEFSFGTILTLDDALSRNKFDVSQTHEFLFRREEIDGIKRSLLNKKIVILHGDAGCGKTRLALEISQELKKENKIFECFYINHAFTNSLSDLQTIFMGKDVVFILDDINRLPVLKDFILYAENNSSIRIIATVRNYAFEGVVSDLTKNDLNSNVEDFVINNLKDEQQEEIIKKVLPNITIDGLHTINNICEHNLRLKIMCAEIIKEGGEVPKKLQGLFEQYFKKHVDFSRLDRKYFKALLIVSFLHRVVIFDDENRDEDKFYKLLENLDLQLCDFFDAMNYWEQKEIVGISFNGKVFEIVDQILANFIFYKFIFEEKIISFQELIEKTFPMYRTCLVEMLNSILPIYGVTENAIVSDISYLWDKKYVQGNCVDHRQFIETFIRLIPEKILSYIQENCDEDDECYLDILVEFESTKYSEIAIDILIKKIPLLFAKDRKKYKELMLERLSISRHSFDVGLSSQIYLLKQLKNDFNLNEVYRELFVDFAQKLLKFSFTTMEANGVKGITCCTFEIVPREDVFAMRCEIWEGLYDLCLNYKEINSCIKAIKSYRLSPNEKIMAKHGEILKKDFEKINEHLKTIDLNTLSFSQKVFVKSSIECCLMDNDERFNQVVKVLLQDKNFRIYYKAHKSENRIGLRTTGISTLYEEAFKEIGSEEDFYNYFDALLEIESLNYLQIAVESLFEYYKITPKKYIEIIIKVLQKYGKYFYRISNIVNNALLILSPSELIKIIQTINSENKGLWLLDIFKLLKEDQINDYIYNLCFQTIKITYIDNDPQYEKDNISQFINFENYRKGFFKNIFVAVKDSKNEGLMKYKILEDFYIYFNDGWTYNRIDIKLIENYFIQDISIYYEMFFILIEKGAILTSDDFVVYLANQNINYLVRYYGIYLKTHNHYMDKGLIKRYPNAAEIMLKIFENEVFDKPLYTYFSLDELFTANLNDESFSKFIELVVTKYIHDKNKLFTFSQVICSMKKEWQVEFALLLTQNKIDSNIFVKLNIFTYPSSWSGSSVTMCEKVIETIEEFLNKVNINKNTLKIIEYAKERKECFIKFKERERLKELADYRFYTT